jgi:MerR family transcriptional regulator, copper efflux regulator
VAKQGLYVSELVARTGTTRKALRVYESAGILPATRRTAAGYRIYDGDAVSVLGFIQRARELGFPLGEIKAIVALKRAGRAPCPHVRGLIRHKLAELDRMRGGLRRLLSSSRTVPKSHAAVCPHIEQQMRQPNR